MKPIAIIGMACRFPAAPDAQTFWSNLVNGVNSIQEIPASRWDNTLYYSADNAPGKTVSKWCGLLADVDQFDYGFFHISPREAKQMDPQQRLLLQEVWHCIEDAGVALSTLQAATTGVYVGVMTHDYQQHALAPEQQTDGFSALGNYECILANRLSHHLNLTGPSLAINTACAASLVALHQAKVSLLNGESDFALAAGVSLNLHPWKYISFSQARMLSPDGQCKAFDQAANGYVPGDGVGSLLLQPLEQALRDGHHIYGIIGGSATNHVGATVSMTAPRVAAQQAVIERAYTEAGIDAETVTYVETHGTGTSLGDPIEIEALTQAFRHTSNTTATAWCRIGSVKTNIGHLEAAAGIAGVIKVLLMMQHQQIPPSLNFSQPNPVINFADSPFQVANELMPWQAASPLRAGVSSFGFGGSNAHVLLEAWQDTEERVQSQSIDAAVAQPFCLSAHNPDSLQALVQTWRDFVNTPAYATLALPAVCATLASGRETLPYRVGCYVQDKADLAQQLATLAMPTNPAAGEAWGLYIGQHEWKNFKQIEAFCAQNPLLAEKLAHIQERFKNNPILAKLKQARWAKKNQPLYTFVANYVYLSTLQKLGLQPHCCSGEGEGLLLAAVLSGMLDLPVALTLLGAENAAPNVDKAVVACPQSLFYDPYAQRYYERYSLTVDYLTELVKPIQFSVEALQNLVSQAQSLSQYQFTFKRYLADWSGLLQQHGVALDARLSDTAWINEHTVAEPEALLLAVVIESSLRQLDRKWALQRAVSLANPHYSELLDLLLDGVLPKASLVTLLLTGSVESPITIPQNAPEISCYPLLSQYQQAPLTVDEIKQWLTKPQLETELPTTPWLLLGHHQPNQPNFSGKVLSLSPEPDHATPFDQTLLQLWLNGVDVQWAQRYPQGQFQTVALPTTHFTGTSLWLPQPPTRVAANVPTTTKASPLYRPVWREQSVQQRVEASTQVVILADNQAIASRLTQHLPHAQVLAMVTPDLLTESEQPLRLYILWGLDAVESISDTDALAAYQQRTVLALFRLSKLLVTAQRPLEFVVVTQGVQHVVDADSTLSPYAAPMLGIAKVLELENPRIQVRCVDLGLNAEAADFALLAHDPATTPYFKEIAYRAGRRYVKQLESIATVPNQPAHAFRVQGCYLILGGLGGVGYVVAQYLAQHYQARLMLVGRSALDAEREQKLQSLRAMGAEAHYLATDVSDEPAVAGLIQHTKQQLGGLHGVIHSAVAMASELLHSMDEADFLRAFSAKSQGSFILGRLLANEAIDFLVFFSSIITFRGDRGGSNYTAGCAFQDAYSHYLQHNGVPALSLDWGRWLDLGVTANARSRRLQGLDSEPLRVEEGLAALEHMLANGLPQMVAAKLAGEWLADDSLLSKDAVQTMTIVQRLTTEIRQQGLNRDLAAGMDAVTHYGRLRLLGALQSVGLFQQPGERISLTALQQRLGVIEKYQRLLQALLDMLLRCGVLQADGDGFVSTALVAQAAWQADLTAVRTALLDEFPAKQAHIELLDAGLAHLPAILNGQIKSTDCLFPNSSLALVEGFYCNNAFADYFNQLVARYLRHEIATRLSQHPAGAKIRLLELGAGTGSTTAQVLDAIADYGNDLEYYYTDISRAFTKHGKQQWGTRYPFMRFELLNVEEETTRYAELGQFDIIFATNVVHATRNLTHSVTHIRQLLKPQGCLLLNELCYVQDFLALTFGLLDGWWLFEDSDLRLPHSPLLSPERWQNLYAQLGFERIEVLGDPDQSEQKQCLIVGYANPVAQTSVPPQPSIAHSVATSVTLTQAVQDSALQQHVTALVATALDVTPQSIDPQAQFNDLGIDSILGVELINGINKHLQQDLLSTAAIYDYPNIQALCAYVAQQVQVPAPSVPLATVTVKPVASASLRQDITALVAKALDVTSQDIDVQAQFSDLGIDSILGVELINGINKQLQQDLLSTAAIYDYPSIQALCDYVAQQLPSTPASPSVQAVNTASVTPPPPPSSRPVTTLPAALSSSATASKAPPQAVAIVGMAGRFPAAENLTQFWENLAQGQHAITDIPVQRWDSSRYLDPDFLAKNPDFCQKGGFLTDIDQFDPLFFNLSPKEAELMDPQQRLFLQCSWHALEDAGYASPNLSGQKVGVFIGMKSTDYFSQILERGLNLDAHAFTGNDSAILSGRLAYHLNFKGPALSIDTACSSSLVAIHLAAEQIRTGRIKMALAGGVLVMTTPQLYTMTLNTGMLSPVGLCKTFDQAADGFVPGEGVGVLVLKALDEAVADGDQIYGVIKGSAINQDGKTNGITAPSTLSQTQVELDVYRQTGIDPESIGYVEAHGTGTKLGDPIEIEALTKAFRHYTQRKNFCAVGSVKSNIGHTMFAAGVAGVIKVLLGLKHQKIPPSLHFNTPNEHIPFQTSPFYVPQTLTDWPVTAGEKRRAAVSAFGFSGTNAHVLIEEYQAVATLASSEPQLIILSAKNRRQLDASAQQLRHFLQAKQQPTSTIAVLPIQRTLCEYLAQLLYVSADEIDTEEALSNLGLDTLVQTTLCERINTHYAVNLTSEDLFDYPHLNALAEYIANTSNAETLSATELPALADIAYTLQVGRMPLEERLALLVTDHADLIAKLGQFVRGDDTYEGLFRGNVKKDNTASSAALVAGKAGAAFLQVAMQERELDKLAALWVAGVEIDWSLMATATGTRPQRVSLPTYPFATGRYWLPEASTTQAKAVSHATANVAVARLHPLIERNTSTLFAQSYSTQMSGEDYFLKHHIINGQGIVPGAVLVAMAQAAGGLAGMQQVTRITAVAWLQPVIVSETPVELTLTLAAEQVERVDYRVSVAGQTAVFAHGKLWSEAATTAPTALDWNAIKARCHQQRQPQQIYATFQQHGVAFGASFQTIQQWYGNTNECWAELVLPAAHHADAVLLPLHPLLLDGAWQVGALLGLNDDDSSTYIPVSLAELQLFQPLTTRCLVYASCVEQDGALYCQLHIADGKGKSLATMRDFVLQRRAVVQPTRLPVATVAYYHETWQASPVSAVEPATASTLLLLFAPDNAQQATLQNHFACPVIWVEIGQHYQRVDATHYRLHPAQGEDYRQLLTEVQQQYGQLPDVVLHLGSQAAFAPAQTDSVQIQLQHSFYSLFHLSQALLHTTDKLVTLLYAYPATAQPLYAALSGFAKTLALETSKLRLKTLALTQFDDLAQVITNELGTQDGIEIRYQPQRESKIWQAWTPDAQTHVTALRRNGVYLITGGAGGLGLIFADYLVRQYQAQLVLTGRSELTTAQIQQLETLGQQGVAPVYLRCDVADAATVEKLIAEIQQRFGGLNGVIHAAGVVRDALLPNKVLEDVETVLAPKVQGSIHLDHATRALDLDCFVLFSGLAAEVGNVGQIDYAYANRFMDNFAAWRESQREAGQRHGKTLAIAWPLWDAGGMQVAEATRAAFEQRLGMQPLATEAGLAAFEQALLSPHSAVLVMAGDSQRLEAQLNPRLKLASTATSTAVSTTTTLPDLQQTLMTLVAAVLKIDLQDIDAHDAFNEYGFDSISFTTLANQINERYDLDLTPAQFFEYPSVARLSEWLLTTYPSHFETATTPSSSMPSPVDASALTQALQNDLITIVATLLKTDTTDIDPQDKLSEYGFDSISFTNLAEALNQRLQLDLTPTTFFDYPSINALVAFLLTDYPTQCAANYQVAEVAPQIAPPLVPVPPTPVEPITLRRLAPAPAAPALPQSIASAPRARKNVPIAIIGMSALLPQSSDLDEFWQHLVAGDDLISEIPADRWDWTDYDGDPSKGFNKTRAKWGGFIRHADQFDAAFFNISPREAALMDPQQRLLLQTVWQSIEHAGYSPSHLAGSNTAVFVGVSNSDYNERVRDPLQTIDAFSTTGTVFSILPNRISYLFDFHGASEAIDTACSSALIAVHKAVAALQNGESDLAIAGGVQLMLSPTLTLSFSKAADMLSQSGRCKTFDSSADGYVRSEGVGAIILKPLDQAEADGDIIHGVILGSAENHGGRANALTAPNPNAQAQLLVQAYSQAGIDPSTVSYIEAHGTGTRLGDPIEINALKQAFGELYQRQGRPAPTEPHCGIGSVKTHIGHLEAMAGLAGIFKVVLSMQHCYLPGLLHFETLNPYIRLDNTPFYIAHQAQTWQPLQDASGASVPLRAGVSSFGFGGSNAHVVLQAYPATKQPTPQHGSQLLLLSAKNTPRLRHYAQSLADYFTRHLEPTAPPLSLADVAYTLQVGREAMASRLALVVNDMETALEKLQQFARDEGTVTNLYLGDTKASASTHSTLIEGEAGRAFLQVILQHRQLDKMAQLWVSGVNIDWQLLYDAGKRPQRVVLPTYPFAPDHHWLAAIPHSPNTGRLAKLHPLLDQNSSTFWQQRFTTVFHGDEFYLSDHILGGQRVLPGVAYLEMARAAGAIAAEQPIYRLESVVWARPLTVPKTTTAIVELSPEGKAANFEISTLVDDETAPPQLHAQGRLYYAQPNATLNTLEPLDLAAIQTRCSDALAGEAFYAILDQWDDADLKTNFQVVKTLYRGNGEALSQLALPSACQAERAQFLLHPSLMDGMVQTAILGVLRDLAAVHVPFGVEQVDIFDDLSACAYAYARLHTTDPQAHNKYLDAYLLDEQGQILVKFNKLAARAFQQPQAAQRATQTKVSPANDATIMADQPVHGHEHIIWTRLQDEIRHIAATLIKVEPKQLELEETLYQYGFESITFTELANHINERFGLALTPAFFFEYNTLNDLLHELWREHRQRFIAHYQPHLSRQTQADAKPEPQTERRHRLAASKRLVERDANLPIAIIGMNGIMPQAENLEAFWQHLLDGDDLVSAVPTERWTWNNIGRQTEVEQGKLQWGGFMPQIDCFDPLFFGISPTEAELMDPQHRLFLQTVWHTVEHAGYRLSALAGSRTGLFVGAATHDYKELLQAQHLDTETYAVTGNVHALIANRVSFLLDLHGPSETIDTACSSALVALHRAVQAIRHEDCTLAIAGGVNVILSPAYALALGQAGDMLSVDGRCKSFDASANGYVRGEGVGAVLLKPLAQAEADGDTIHGVIRGSAENHGGHATSLTAPNPQAQAQLLISAYQDADVDPATVSYIEAHGTGTKLGDPIEVNGLKIAFDTLYQQHGHAKASAAHCGIGTVKTNVGHLETAAGMAGLFKILLSMRHGVLPRLLHFQQRNPFVELDHSPFYLVTENQPWQPLADKNAQTIPRRAGISAFGFGGANAHVVLEAYPAPTTVNENSLAPKLFLLSAKNPVRLNAYLQRFIAFLQTQPLPRLLDMAYTLAVGRDAMEERLALVFTDAADLLSQLQDLTQGQTANSYRGNVKSRSKPDAVASQRVAELMHQAQLDELAQLWVSGMAIDWRLLYQDKQPQRVPLPTYPFAAERHWLPQGQGSVAKLNISDVPRLGLHPLLDSNESTLHSQQFKKVLQRELFYLRDHVVQGQALLPGVAYLELARAGAQLAMPEQVVTRLSQVMWVQPVVVEDSQTIYLELTPHSHERVDFEVLSLDAAQQPQIHAQGRVHYATSPAQADAVDLAALRQRCNAQQSHDTFYTAYSANGFEYGTGFRTVESVQYNESEALATLRLPDFLHAAAAEFLLHPSLMDGALQTVSSLLSQHPTEIYLPFALGEVTIMVSNGLPLSCYAYARLSEGATSTDTAVKRFDISLLDPNGQVLVAMKAFAARKVAINAVTDDVDMPLMNLLQRLTAGELNQNEVKQLMLLM